MVVGEGVKCLGLPPIPAGEVSSLPDGDGAAISALAHLYAQLTCTQAVKEVPEFEAFT